MMKIVTILGTRPEIIKLSPLIQLLDKEFEHIIVHTGQHYSYQMDKIFFEELDLRDCDYMLNVGSGTHAQQTALMMIKIEKVLIREKPDIVLVQGDTNSTLAGAITASKINIDVAHVEAGCRSFDKNMPEEINRIIVDHCSNFLFAPDNEAFNNLINEGINQNKIYIAGNTSIDACIRITELSRNEILKKFDLRENEYVLLTLHRQENTEYKRLKGILEAINDISKKIKIVFPIHFRTKKVIDKYNIKLSENIFLTPPLGYRDFIRLLSNSKFVMTDSGGIQEESAVLNVPCLILRDNTEWSYLIDVGKNMLIGTSYEKIFKKIDEILCDEKLIKKMINIRVPVKVGASKKIVNILKKVNNNL
ncbi:MAG: UDP-N-acetylglucosamine 2-epimerase (non-hydrolyzing) [Methanobacteriaceae archaeon]